MFYADFVLSKKGPLSQVWLAAHWEKKLSKAQIVETDVDAAVNEMMRPSQGLALRTTGHLLLGICRVFSRKTKYLLADTNEAFLKIKLVFRSGALDEPNPVFPTFSNQDIYGDFGDNILPEFDDEDLNHAPICQSRIDDITMKEDLAPLGGSYNYNEVLEDDDFGEIAAGVQPEDYLRLMQEMEELAGASDKPVKPVVEEEDTSETNNGSMFGRERESTPALAESHAPGSAIFQDDDFSGAVHHEDERMDEDDHNFQSTSGSRIMPIDDMDYDDNLYRQASPLREETAFREETPRTQSPTPSVAPSTTAHQDQDTVESFYEKHAQKRALAKELTVKKRKMDDVRMITGEEMKANMADYRELLVHLDLAPPTRKLMVNKRRCHAEFLLHFPGMIGFTKNKQYIRDYQSLLTVKKQEDDEERKEAIKNALGLWEIGEADLQAQQHEIEMSMSREDPIYDDDFDAASHLDFNAYDDFDMPMQEIDLGANEPERNPLSPFAPMIDEEESSPSEKRRKITDDKDEKDEMDDSAIDEDNRWSKRTQTMLHTISSKLEHTSIGQIELDEVLKKGTSRKIAAQKFYSILCLKKNQCIDVEQKTPFGDIMIKAGPNINASLL